MKLDNSTLRPAIIILKKESVNACISLWSSCTWLEPEFDRVWSDTWRFRFQSANKHHRLETPNILGCDSPKADKFHVCYCDRHYARGSGRGFIFGVGSGENFKTCGRFPFAHYVLSIYIICKLNRWYKDIWHLPFLLTIHLLIYLLWHWFFRIRLVVMPHWLIELVSILCRFIWFLRVFDFAPHLFASLHHMFAGFSLAKPSIPFS